MPDDRKGKQEGKIVDDANVKDPFADSPWEKRSDNGGDVAASNTNTKKDKDEDDEEESGGDTPWLWYLIAGIVVLAIAAAGVV